MVYSAGELEVIAQQIAQHEAVFNYMVTAHTHVAESIHQAVSAYRSQYI